MFAFYAARFRTVEINYTFYRMPTPKTTEAWRDQAPHGFSYALKAPRRITHERRLRECGDEVTFFCDSARRLGDHLAPALFQLPPNLKCDLDRLDRFLGDLPADVPAAFEFRHDSWLTEPVLARLRDHGAALCVADSADRHPPVEVTARHGYFRLRDEGYTAADLARWADAIASRAADWDDVYVYFKHEEEGRGPEFAAAFVAALRTRGLA
jgi:uncharacterized protein YecE (DUF72 family)